MEWVNEDTALTNGVKDILPVKTMIYSVLRIVIAQALRYSEIEAFPVQNEWGMSFYLAQFSPHRYQTLELQTRSLMNWDHWTPLQEAPERKGRRKSEANDPPPPISVIQSGNVKQVQRLLKRGEKDRELFSDDTIPAPPLIGISETMRSSAMWALRESTLMKRKEKRKAKQSQTPFILPVHSSSPGTYQRSVNGCGQYQSRMELRYNLDITDIIH
ncbi:hypothetical protein C0J52_07089 [Blattella germanica]|nr:hypothetical protein C0J52_07089 [Blattella germanica]